MFEQFQRLLAEIKQRYADKRENLLELEVDYIDSERLVLSGRVLEESNLEDVRQAVMSLSAQVRVDASAVQVLRSSQNPVLTVWTNLTSLHSAPDFLAEQISQLLFGRRVEVLIREQEWAFVRCDDGYLGWTYLPHLREIEAETASHLVTAPVGLLHAAPDEKADLLSRIYGGTFLRVLKQQATWALVQAHYEGWLPQADLRSLHAIPTSSDQRRAQMVLDARRLVGVPYLWGGVSANGIDCSGFAQLVHRWSGLTLRRDADIQMLDGHPLPGEQMQSGDLAFFGEQGERRSITHVGLSLGGWKIIHSSRSRNGVYIDDIQQVPHLRDSFVGACTYLY